MTGHGMHRCNGLTVLELLLVLGIVAILALIVVPGLGRFVADLRMTAAVNAFVHAIHLARQEAHKRGTTATLCKSPGGLQCNAAADWSDGWLVFINQDQDDPPHVDADEPVLHANSGFTNGRISANRSSFTLRAFGKRSTNGTLVFCNRTANALPRAVIVSYSGKPRISDTTASGAALRCVPPA
jgi:type IV fimbrial biogenesis protein FimT